MSTQGITPRLADRLCSLAESQLQTQAARSASVDAGALGVVSACVAIAALVLTVKRSLLTTKASLARTPYSSGRSPSWCSPFYSSWQEYNETHGALHH